MWHFLRKYSIYFAWLVTLVATLLSLYFSVIQGMEVCDLCWYQRICIYPLMIILGIAAYREDYKISLYTIPLAVLGCVFALYQYLEQMTPGFSPLHICSENQNCGQIEWIWLGFITLPLLSLLSNLVALFFLWLARAQSQHSA